MIERHALEALRLNPNRVPAHCALAAWHYRHGRLEPATASIEAAAALAPGDRSIAVSRASILLASGKVREAWEAMQPFADAEVPDRWIAGLSARAASAVKQEQRALEMVEQALRAPGLSSQADGKPMLHFAASTLLDKLGRYDEAFEQARLGNDTIRTAVRRHDPEGHSEWVTNKVRYFTRRRLKSLPRATHDNRRPVFIVGMPRSGTSLVEQILSCHPQVHGAGELNALRLIAKGSSEADWSEGAAYPEALDGLSLSGANRLAEQYLAAACAGSGDATYVTDKQPLNFLLLDLVELLFPHCHVIHCVRNPIDTCLSCFMTNFEQSNPFKFDLAHLGAYYRDYRRLMEHWKKVLTVPMLEVRYEDVVLDTEGQARRMLEFLNLPWDEQCLELPRERPPRPHRQPRPGAAADLHLVDQPLEELREPPGPAGRGAGAAQVDREQAGTRRSAVTPSGPRLEPLPTIPAHVFASRNALPARNAEGTRGPRGMMRGAVARDIPAFGGIACPKHFFPPHRTAAMVWTSGGGRGCRTFCHC